MRVLDTICHYGFFVVVVLVFVSRGLSKLFWLLTLYIKKKTLTSVSTATPSVIKSYSTCPCCFHHSSFSCDLWAGSLQMWHLTQHICGILHSMLLWETESLCFCVPSRCSWKCHLLFQCLIFRSLSSLKTFTKHLICARYSEDSLHTSILWRWYLSSSLPDGETKA